MPPDWVGRTPDPRIGVERGSVEGTKAFDTVLKRTETISTEIDGSFFPWCDILACNQRIQTAAQRGIECLELSSSLAFWLEPITCKYARRLVFCRFAAHGSIFSRSRSPLARSWLRLPAWPWAVFCFGAPAELPHESDRS